MKPVAIIPAKSKSTRLPSKNILEIAGKPMILHTINSLKKSGIFSAIWVSTDSQEIADICAEAGAKTHIRPLDLAEDRSTVNEVCFDWLNSLKSCPNVFCCVYATSIFLTPQDFIDAFSLLSNDVDGVMGVSQYNYPPVQALTPNNSGFLSMLMPEYEKVQSQFFPECYVSNGSQYWVRTEAYQKEKSFYLSRLKPFVTREDHILDINTKEDFEIAIERSKRLGWHREPT